MMTLECRAWDRWAACNGVVAVYLHGSQTSRPRPESDVDLALLLRDDLVWDEVERLREEAYPRLADALGLGEVSLDVQVLNRAPPAFQQRVIACRKLLWEGDHRLRVSFEREAMREYLDLRFYLDQHDGARQRRLEEGTFGRRPQIHPTPAR